MKKFISRYFLTTLFAISVLPGSIRAQYQAIQIPDEKLLSITLDGDTKDWSWVPSKYIIRPDKFNCKPEKIAPADYDVRLVIGWSALKNWIYFVIEIDDNLFMGDEGPSEAFDKVSIYIDPAGNRRDYRQGHFVTKCELRLSNKDERDDLAFIQNGTGWMHASPYCMSKKKIVKSKLSTRITYEIGMLLWDEWNPSGPGNSRPHRIEGDPVSIIFIFADVDENRQQKNVLTSQIPYSGGFWWETSNAFSVINLEDSIKSQVKSIK